MNTFKYKVVPKVLLSIEDVTSCSSDQHYVYELLGRIAMVRKKSIVPQVHLIMYVLNTSG